MLHHRGMLLQASKWSKAAGVTSGDWEEMRQLSCLLFDPWLLGQKA